MVNRIIIPLYKADEDYFNERLKENRGIKSATAFALIKSGIKHWKKDIHFNEYISVPTYPATTKIGFIPLDLDMECEEWQTINDIHLSQKIPRSKVARFFMFYDWRYQK